MQYVEIAKLAFAVLGIIIDIAKDHKAGGTDSDRIVDRIIGSVKSIGTVAKVKELEDLDLTSIAPELKAFIHKVRALKNTVELPK